jgi:hypothetical protein
MGQQPVYIRFAEEKHPFTEDAHTLGTQADLLC